MGGICAEVWIAWLDATQASVPDVGSVGDGDGGHEVTGAFDADSDGASVSGSGCERGDDIDESTEDDGTGGDGDAEGVSGYGASGGIA